MNGKGSKRRPECNTKYTEHFMKIFGNPIKDYVQGEYENQQKANGIFKDVALETISMIVRPTRK